MKKEKSLQSWFLFKLYSSKEHRNNHDVLIIYPSNVYLVDMLEEGHEWALSHAL